MSPEIRVILRPKATFAELKDGGGRWLYWRRPLLQLLILCSTISLLSTARFSLHVVGSTAIYWSFLPLVEITGLAAVERRWPKAGTVDRFFTGHGLWLLFLIAIATFDLFAPGALGRPHVFNTWLAVTAGVLLWSLWIDYCFFGSASKVALQRAVSWTLFVAIFAGSGAVVEISRVFGL